MTRLIVPEVAARLRCQPPTVTALIRKGDLEASKVGRRWLVTEDAVERYLDSRSNRTTARRRRRRAA